MSITVGMVLEGDKHFAWKCACARHAILVTYCQHCLDVRPPQLNKIADYVAKNPGALINEADALEAGLLPKPKTEAPFDTKKIESALERIADALELIVLVVQRARDEEQ